MPSKLSGVAHQSTVTVGTGAAVQLVAARPQRSFVIQNTGANDLYIGDSTVTASGATAGLLLKGGQTPPTSFSDATIYGPVYGIAVTGSTTAAVFEVYP
jgi:hypothetical protein